MEKENVEKIFNEIIEMKHNISELKDNTHDNEMRKYFLGFDEALDWVTTEVFRWERINHKIVFKIEDSK